MYAAPSVIVGSVTAWLYWVLNGAHTPVPPELLITPMTMLFTLTALVWLVMVVVRNVAVIRGQASIRYFADYVTDVPVDDRLERPARTFNNLMQVPTLFYVVCILMLVTREIDSVQIWLAWTFVVLRWLHAIVYMTLNSVPYRFALWASSCLALGLIWYRVAAQVPLN